MPVNINSSLESHLVQIVHRGLSEKFTQVWRKFDVQTAPHDLHFTYPNPCEIKDTTRRENWRSVQIRSCLQWSGQTLKERKNTRELSGGQTLQIL